MKQRQLNFRGEAPRNLSARKRHAPFYLGKLLIRCDESASHVRGVGSDAALRGQVTAVTTSRARRLSGGAGEHLAVAWILTTAVVQSILLATQVN